MPPWLPDAGGPKFVGERRLRDDQIATIERWAQAGALEGDPADLPAHPIFPTAWQLGTPDAVATMTRPYQLQSGRRDVLRNVVLPLSLGSTRFVRAVEFRTGGAPIHHAVIRLDRTSASRRRDGADGQPGFDGMLPEVQDPGGYYLGWAPGQGPMVAAEGMPWRLDRGSDLVVELHLLPGAAPVSVQPTVGLFFADKPATESPVLVVMGSKLIDIPAGARDFEISDRYELPVDVDLLSVYPHAHFLGKQMEARATLPDGTTRRLLQIERWDFHWQQEYRWVEPLRLPRGTTLFMRYTYDNSDANRNNPHHPPQRVTFGQRSSDEMGTLGLQLLPRSPADGTVLIEAFADREAKANVAAAEMLVRINPASAENLLYLGRSYRETGKSALAVAPLEAARRLDPRSAVIERELGDVLVAEQRTPEAVERFRRAVELAPRDAFARFTLGKALYAVGAAPEATREFERAIALDPTFAEAHGNLAFLLFARDDLAQAIVHFRHAADLAPDSAVAASDLGAALAQAGRTDEALTHIRRALDIDPSYQPARDNLARIERRRPQ